MHPLEPVASIGDQPGMRHHAAIGQSGSLSRPAIRGQALLLLSALYTSALMGMSGWKAGTAGGHLRHKTAHRFITRSIGLGSSLCCGVFNRADPPAATGAKPAWSGPQCRNRTRFASNSLSPTTGRTPACCAPNMPHCAKSPRWANGLPFPLARRRAGAGAGSALLPLIRQI